MDTSSPRSASFQRGSEAERRACPERAWPRPHAAGVAALLYEQKGDIFPANVRINLAAADPSVGSAPNDNPTGCYSFDGKREGVLSAPRALAR
jgi:hypothetical protein